MSNDDLQYLLFYVGDEIYAVSTQYVQEMLPTPKVTDVPGALDDIRGVINLRGKVLRVLDLRRRFRMKILAVITRLLQ